MIRPWHMDLYGTPRSKKTELYNVWADYRPNKSTKYLVACTDGEKIKDIRTYWKETFSWLKIIKIEKYDDWKNEPFIEGEFKFIKKSDGSIVLRDNKPDSER